MSFSIETYQYAHAPRSLGLSVGVVRHLPRGVRKGDYQRGGYFDVWLPMLAPTAGLVAAYRSGDLSFRAFSRHYRSAMKAPEARQVIRMLAATSRVVPVRLGCFCEDARRCHRSILRELVEKATGELPAAEAGDEESRPFSPPCFMPEIDD